MLRTRFCQRFGIDAPIVVAPMGPDAPAQLSGSRGFAGIPIFRDRVRAGFPFPSARFGIGFNARMVNQCLGLGVYVFNPHALAGRPREHSQTCTFPS